MTSLEWALSILLFVTWVWLWGYLYGNVGRERAVQTAWAECRERVAIYNEALDSLSKSKWVKWNYLHDRAKKAERGSIKP